MNKIEACEKIIEQDGDCKGVTCRECPLDNTGNCATQQDKLISAKQYLADHKQEEKTYSVEFTDDELKELHDFCQNDFCKNYNSFESNIQYTSRYKIVKKYLEINEPKPGDRCAFSESYLEWCDIMEMAPSMRDNLVFNAGYMFRAIENKEV